MPDSNSTPQRYPTLRYHILYSLNAEVMICWYMKSYNMWGGGLAAETAAETEVQNIGRSIVWL